MYGEQVDSWNADQKYGYGNVRGNVGLGEKETNTRISLLIAMENVGET